MKNRSMQSVMLCFLFVVIYGSGFVGAKLGLLYSEPFTFLAMRFALAGGLLVVAAILLDATWPRQPGWLLLSGLMMQGVFSVGVFYALYLGMKPAVSALIIALQPLLVTVLAGPYLGEKVGKQRWIGLFIGVLGVTLVVADGLAVEGISVINLSWALLSLIGLTAGQLIQKKHCADMNLISGGAIQVLATLPLMLLLGWLFESGELVWHLDLVIAIFWMAVGVSIGALSLLYILLLRNSASQVASVFYGVPVAAALIAWPLFDQVPTAVDWAGFMIVVVGILVANYTRGADALACRKPIDRYAD
ncbi:DMT family transporter [uncultured Neptuniibacter sp.]|uniref:DMT family transporter n=1 Tax=uncultured Neptuniibacter sp. TaxID=502143 RepID=UPI0026074FFF|nr:DMT family transporter [uncultured Neptuniibacter sp.]